MTVTFLGVRHHSPACARHVADVITRLRPAHVLVEGPSDMNDRLDELLLDHKLPIAVFSSYRDDARTHTSWSPFCEYSPEWVALQTGRQVGAQLRFIDLPAWHEAFSNRSNRYSDAEERYSQVLATLCREFAVDHIDALWDHLFEVEPADRIGERLDRYFDLLRGQSEAGDADSARESYMAQWIRRAALDGDVVVVTGGFHQPALKRLVQSGPPLPDSAADWPAALHAPEARSFLVPYSFKRLDSFDGYQSGMPSPGYYQQVWERGVAAAATDLIELVTKRLRARKQQVSTADLIAAHALTAGLARLRGHQNPGRTDVLDGLVSALVTDPLDQPLPWTVRGPLQSGTDAVVVEMVSALSGSRVGRLHPDTPQPPLVHDVTAELDRHRLSGSGAVEVDLLRDLERSRVLHRLRLLEIPGFQRTRGPRLGADPVTTETWKLTAAEGRLVALIEAGAYGTTLAEAATGRLEERAQTRSPANVAAVLFDAVLSGSQQLSERLTADLRAAIRHAGDLSEVGTVLAATLALWRHGDLYGTTGDPLLFEVVEASQERALWLVEGLHGGPAPADSGVLNAVVAVRDAVRYAIAPDTALAVMGRVRTDKSAPPAVRGAAFGFGISLGHPLDTAAALRGADHPDTLGDWLAGLFALAREEVVGELLGLLDEILCAMPGDDFLTALPSLRQAFGYFPPREREQIAQQLLDRRGLTGSARALLRTAAPALLIAQGQELDMRVDRILTREGLV